MMLLLLLASSLVSAEYSEGPKTKCIPDESVQVSFLAGGRDIIRCGQGYNANWYTGKCVPAAEEWLDPMTCSETKCGTRYTCDPKTILCLKNDFPRRTIVEKAPKLKLCKDVYGFADGLWWGNDDLAETEAKLGTDAEGPKTMCLGDHKGYGVAGDFVSGMSIRCARNWKLSGYTGKCVPEDKDWVDPLTCSETKCGTLYRCDPKTILCLKRDFPRSTIVEKAPPLKLCKDVYGDPDGMWFGETADEVALGFNQESDESYLAMATIQSNTSVLVYMFAVFGFGVVAYGAVQHYTKA